MNKKIRLISLLLAMAALLCLAGCGSSAKDSSAPTAASGANSQYVSYDSAADYDEALPEEAEMESAYGVGGRNDAVPTAQDLNEKIIYNADINLETTEFDSALERLAALVTELGGYVESSSISGSNYNSIARGSAGARNADYVIRIPSAGFSAFTGGVEQLGNVPYSRTYTRNITTEYYDTKSRLDAYQVQEKRLLEMLAAAETVEDMLAIQRELTDVQYEIDSLTGRLRYFDNQVGYSTVYLNVQEVREYTPEPTIKLTYWERMSKGFKESLRETGRFFTELFLWFVTSLPWLIPLGAVLAGLIALLRRHVSGNSQRAARRAERRAARDAARAARKAAKNGEKPEE